MVPADAPGVIVHDDWDALGMRASGSDSISSRASGCPSPVCAAASVREIRCRTWRTSSPGYLTPRPRSGSPSGPTRSPAAAWPSRSTATRAPASKSPTTPSTSPPHAASSGVRRRSSTSTAPPTRRPTAAPSSSAPVAEAQAAKAFVNEAAARIVDRALALSSGAGYLKRGPLAAPTTKSRPARSCAARRQARLGFLGHVALREERH